MIKPLYKTKKDAMKEGVKLLAKGHKVKVSKFGKTGWQVGVY